MANNSKQCFNTHYQPHCHPTTKSLWLCSSVYCRPPHQSRRIWLVAAATNQKQSCTKWRLFCLGFNVVRWTNHAVYSVYCANHDDVIKWKQFLRYWPFVRGIHRSPVNSPHKAQWRGALMLSLICTRINGWVSIGEAGDLRRYRAHIWRHHNAEGIAPFTIYNPIYQMCAYNILICSFFHFDVIFYKIYLHTFSWHIMFRWP